MVWIRNPLSDVGQRRVSEYGQDGNKTKRHHCITMTNGLWVDKKTLFHWVLIP
jgi:hypothetical protein